MLILIARVMLSSMAALFVLSSCSSMATVLTPKATFSDRTNDDYKVSSGLLFVALSGIEAPYDQVNVYDARRKDPAPLAIITSGISYPESACIDKQKHLYVTNQGGGYGWISEYTLGKTTPFSTITDGVNGPAYCAIDAAGNLWVTNINTPDVVEYKPGSTSPKETITNGIVFPIGIAIDHFGNMYVVNRASQANVVVYPPRSKSPSRTITDGVSFPEGIAVDDKATLYLANYIPGNIEEYRVGHSEPYRTITKKMNGPIGVTFARDGWFYVSNEGNGTGKGGTGPGDVILKFPPNAVVPSRHTISKALGFPSGSAYYPPLLP